MERRKFWLSSAIKKSFFLPTKFLLTNAASHLRYKAKEKSQGLVSLYKDMEACSGYEDIQVMWEMIHSSSCHAHKEQRSKKQITVGNSVFNKYDK